MMTTNWTAVLSTICLLGASQVAAAVMWEAYPGIRSPGQIGIVIGDFDGDGAIETAVSGSVTPDPAYQSRLLAIVASSGPGNYAISAMSVLTEPLIGTMVRAPREGTADRLVSIVRGFAEEQVVILGGVPLRVLRTMEAPMVRRIYTVVDVDADGRQEIIASTEERFDGYPVILDYATGAIEWVGANETNSVATAQLDDDPALEVILGGTPGRIVDGATRSSEWVYPGGFLGTILVGRFSSDPGVRTFAAASGRVQVFRSQPYSPMWEFTTYGGTASLANPTFDGLDQIAIGSKDHLSIHDPRTGSTSVDIYGTSPQRMVFGDIDGDTHAEVIYNESYPSDGNVVRVVDLATQSEEYVQRDGFGPYSALVRGDIAGGGTDEIAHVAKTKGWGQAQLEIHVLDAASGALVRRHTVFEGGANYGLAMAQLDADPQMELIVAGTDSYNGAVVAIDGSTFVDQWRVSGNDSAIANYRVDALAMIDQNEDGIRDVVAAAMYGGTRIFVFDGRNGNVLWQSVSLDASENGFDPAQVAAFHLQAGTSQALLTLDDGIYVFDLASGLLAQTMKIGSNVVGLWQWGDYAGCRFATLDESSTITVYRCAGLEKVGAYPAPPDTTFFRPIYDGAPRFLVASGSRLYVSKADGTSFPVSRELGQQIGADNYGVLRPGSDAEHFDLVIGSNYMVTRMPVSALGVVFANGFD